MGENPLMGMGEGGRFGPYQPKREKMKAGTITETADYLKTVYRSIVDAENALEC